MIRLAPCLLLLGCAYTPDMYQEEVTAASCERVVACSDFYDTVEACVTATQDEVEDTRGCTYDSTAATDCVDAVTALECPGGNAIPDEPDVCRAVWTCE